jgi:hypothetical protein
MVSAQLTKRSVGHARHWSENQRVRQCVIADSNQVAALGVIEKDANDTLLDVGLKGAKGDFFGYILFEVVDI